MGILFSQDRLHRVDSPGAREVGVLGLIGAPGFGAVSFRRALWRLSFQGSIGGKDI